jgi:hypothetical protein
MYKRIVKRSSRDENKNVVMQLSVFDIFNILLKAQCCQEKTCIKG